ncbi:hypothetical protein Q8A73_021156 [Channa argus]|nr:hypothetical protein Q8A73_021156 [Channa argus]
METGTSCQPTSIAPFRASPLKFSRCPNIAVAKSLDKRTPVSDHNILSARSPPADHATAGSGLTSLMGPYKACQMNVSLTGDRLQTGTQQEKKENTAGEKTSGSEEKMFTEVGLSGVEGVAEVRRFLFVALESASIDFFSSFLANLRGKGFRYATGRTAHAQSAIILGCSV